MGNSRFYILKNNATGDEFVGTMSELSKYYGISTTALSNMALNGSLYNGIWSCKEKIDGVYCKHLANELDKIALEARKHDMSYGQYVAMTENLWKYKYV